MTEDAYDDDDDDDSPSSSQDASRQIRGIQDADGRTSGSCRLCRVARRISGKRGARGEQKKNPEIIGKCEHGRPNVSNTHVRVKRDATHLATDSASVAARLGADRTFRLWGPSTFLLAARRRRSAGVEDGFSMGWWRRQWKTRHGVRWSVRRRRLVRRNTKGGVVGGGTEAK